MAKFFSFFFFFVLFTIILLVIPTLEQVLHTNGRWIVEKEGNNNNKRVKLSCVNWVSHLESSVAEGLSKQPLDVISKGIRSMGFNCVRLTWPLLLVTNESFGFNLTVRDSLTNLGLVDSINGLQLNNPSILNLPLIKAFQAVVKSLGDNKVMVILDNHITQPGWCCSALDGNGFFGDKYFDPELWIMGLSKMATIFNGVTNVVAMSLRNELRGPKQNINDWFRYMSKGAEAVHASNKNVLVILSGLNYDTDLSFLQNQPVNLSFNGKLVLEAHQYSFSDTQTWSSLNPNKACAKVTEKMMRNYGFLLEQEQGFPLFISEFGFDMRGTNVNDDRFLNCFMGLLAEFDLDWGLWTLVGSYYIREGVVGVNEYYGVLTYDWSHVRNSSFLQRLSSIQIPFRGPFISEAKQQKVIIIFHPLTCLCVIRNSLVDSLRLGPCSSSDGWNYTPKRTLSINGTYFCLQADNNDGEGKPAKLGTSCSAPNSIWEFVSDSKMQISSKISNSNNGNGSSFCLDVDSNNIIVTNTCKCLSIDDNSCDPASQWFKLVNTTRES